MKSLLVLLLAGSVSISAWAKLPAPSDEAKAKAAEASAKAAHAGKVENYQLCKSQDKVAAHYRATQKNAPKAAASAPCVDPGPFVAQPPATAAAPAAAPSPAAPAAAPPAAGKKS